MAPSSAFSIRECRAEDLAAITGIYGHWVQHGLASFELEAPCEAEMLRRFTHITTEGYPYIVATGKDGQILGYAYASSYRTRPAYRFTVENSVYMAPDAAGKGIGRALLEALIARCTHSGFRAMVAVIGDSANHASIGLHRAAGFTPAGVLPHVGWKHGQWVDSIQMVRPLGDGASTPPQERPRTAP